MEGVYLIDYYLHALDPSTVANLAETGAVGATAHWESSAGLEAQEWSNRCG
jgi:hypothetical protein